MLFSVRVCLKHLCRDRSGVALIEFVFFFPIAVILLFGALELGRYTLILQKIEKSGYVIGDVVTQYTQNDLTQVAVDTVFSQFSAIMDPYGRPEKQAVIISSVTKDPVDHKIKIRWQRAGGGSLRNSVTRSIVSDLRVDQVPTVIIGIEAKFTGDVAAQLETMRDGENMIVAELFFAYTPVFTDWIRAGVVVTTTRKFSLAERTLVRRTFFHPRLGDLNNPPI